MISQKIRSSLITSGNNIIKKMSGTSLSIEQGHLVNGTSKIGVVQLCSTPDKTETFEQASDMIRKCAESGAQIVFLPECCDYVSQNTDQAIKLAEKLDGSLIKSFKSLAKELNVWLSLGGIHESKIDDSNRVSNCHVILNNIGGIVAAYRKIHLYDVDIPGKIRLKESAYTIPGNRLVAPVHSPCGELGLGICYDLRFPEFSQWLRASGAQILTYPSAFTVPTGKAHWHTLLQARAIETQSYVIAAAQCGAHNSKRSSFGHSLVVDPWGTIQMDLGEEAPCFGVLDLDLNFVVAKREEMPIENHKRHDLYVTPIDYSRECYNMPENKVSWKGLDEGFFRFGPNIKIENSCIFFLTARSVAFVNLRPIKPGHVLVCPRRLVERNCELNSSEIIDLWSTVQKVQKCVQQVFDTNSSTIAIQDGPHAGQSVCQLHVHIVPRKENDFSQNDEVYSELETHEKKPDRPARNQFEMEEEAAKLRKYFYNNIA